MSDDDYDDEFDGDFIWFDDIEADLADDLAGGTMHSPVLLDHPVFDTMDITSDWEYYSDDYFDDDPSVIRKNKETAASDDKKRSVGGKRKKKKRRLTPTEDIPDMDLGEPMDYDKKLISTDTFKNVVWRTSHHCAGRSEIYEPGQGEVVALLKNWREVFKSSQPRSDRRTQKSGQGSEVSKPGRKPGPVKTGKGSLSGRKENIYDADDDEEMDDGKTQSMSTAPLTPPPSSLSTSEEQARPSRKTRSIAGSKLNNVVSATDSSTDPNPQATTLPTRQTQPISPSSDPPPHAADSLPRTQPKNGGDLPATSEASQPPPTPRRGKRKAATSLDEEEEDAGVETVASTSTRQKSKRLATRKLDNGDQETAPPPPTRASRGRPKARGRGQR